MSIAARAQSLLVDVNRPGNMIRRMYDFVSPLPGGTALFSRLVGQAAPYTGSMGARVEEVREGYARVKLRDRRAVRNHLNCIHAVALANLAELTGNLALAYSLPSDARFIVAGMNIEYLHKARGTITAETHCPVPDTSDKQTYPVLVVLRDRDGTEVVRATLQSLVGPKKPA
jgi:uncharacterized protein (TIGR00369 family)